MVDNETSNYVYNKRFYKMIYIYTCNNNMIVIMINLRLLKNQIEIVITIIITMTFDKNIINIICDKEKYVKQ